MGLWSFQRGTTSNILGIGDGVDSDKKIEANVPGADKPALRFNHTTGKWEVSHNGTDFADIGVSAGLFEIEVDGGLMPVTTVGAVDEYYELDGNDDITPKAA